jgi:hypothetical protein
LNADFLKTKPTGITSRESWRRSDDRDDRRRRTSLQFIGDANRSTELPNIEHDHLRRQIEKQIIRYLKDPENGHAEDLLNIRG